MDRLLTTKAVAVAGVTAIAILGFLGIWTILDPTLAAGRFALDKERTVPAAFSVILLVTGALIATSIGRSGADTALRWRLFGVVLFAMSLDEALGLHEFIEADVGIDWQILYVPIVAFAAIAWWLVFDRLSSLARVLFSIGAAAWASSQVLEWLQWSGGDVELPHYHVLMVPEELLEMAGSLLFVLALIAFWSATSASERALPRGGG